MKKGSVSSSHSKKRNLRTFVVISLATIFAISSIFSLSFPGIDAPRVASASGGASINVQGTTAVFPGSVVTVDGSGFTSHSYLSADLYGSSVDFVTGECVADSSGSFSCQMVVPSVSCYSLTSGCPLTGLTFTDSSGVSASEYSNSGDGEPLPGIGVYPDSGAAGATVTLYGDGYIGKIAPKTLKLGVDMDLSAFVKVDGIEVVSSVLPFSTSCVPWRTGQLSDDGCTLQIPDLQPGTYKITIDVYINGFIPDHPCAHFFQSECTEETFFTVNPPQMRVTPGEVSPSTSSSVTVSGSGYNPVDTSVLLTLPGVSTLGSCPLSFGSFSCSVTIPSNLPAGPNTILAEGNNGGDVALNPPVDTGSTSLDVVGPYPLRIFPNYGLIGSNITISGWGYDLADTSVYPSYGTGPCPLTWGHFSCTVTVPTGLSAGHYTLQATGDLARDTDTGSFYVVAGIALNSTTANVGDVIDISGSGLASGDNVVHLTMDGNPVGPSSGCSVFFGAFPVHPSDPCAFTVPPIGGGGSTITATGNTGDSVSTTLDVMPKIFLSPSVTIAPINGIQPVVNVTGTGFTIGDTSVGILFDSAGVIGSCTGPMSDGNVSCSFQVPSLSPFNPVYPGEHVVEVVGDLPFVSFGQGSNIETASANLLIAPYIAPDCYDTQLCQPGFGAPGSQFSLSADNFPTGVFGDDAATIMLDGINIGTCYMNSGLSTGTFSNCGLTVPNVPPGVYTIQAVGDNSGDVGTANFTVLGMTAISSFGVPGSSLNLTGYALPYVGNPGNYVPTTTLAWTFYGQVGYQGFVLNVGGLCPVSTTTGEFNCQISVPNDAFVDPVPGVYQIGALVNNVGCGALSSGCSFQTSFLVTNPTQTEVSCSPQNVTPGSSSGVTCTADVKDVGMTPSLPIGGVQFLANYGSLPAYLSIEDLGNPQSSCMLSPVSGSPNEAQCSITFFPVSNVPYGTYNITALYLLPPIKNFVESPSAGETSFSIADPTQTLVICAASTTTQGNSCTAKVSDLVSPSSAPSGTVTFSYSGTSGGSFSSPTCSITSNFSCSVIFSPPSSSGSATITASFAPGSTDQIHAASQGSLTLYSVTFAANGFSDGSQTGTIFTANTYAITTARPYHIWLPAGDSVSFNFNSIVSSSNAGEQFALTSSSQTSPITNVEGPIVVTAQYHQQFYLNVNSPCGSTGSDWYNVDSIATVTTRGVCDRSGGSGIRISSYNINGIFGSNNNELTAGMITVNVPIGGPTTMNFVPTTQFYLANNDPGGAVVSITLSTISGDAGWYDAGTPVNVVLNNVIDASSTQRDNLLSYTLDTTTTINIPRSASGTFSFSFTMDQAHTILSTYVTQFPLTVTGGNNVAISTPSPTGDSWYDVGTPLTVSSDWVWNTITSQSRTALTNWFLNGVGQNPIRQGAGILTTSMFTMSGPTEIDLISTTQYYVSVSSAFDTPVLSGSQTGDNWIDSGTMASFSVNSSVPCGTGCREVFTSWSGSYAESNNPATVSVNDPITENANWQEQFLLTVTPNGITAPVVSPNSPSGYYDAGTLVTLTTSNTANGYSFITWNVDGINQTLLANTTSVTMDSPHIANAIYEAPSGALSTLASTINGMNLQGGTAHSLLSKVSGGQDALNHGDLNAAVSQLEALIHEVNAQSGEHISSSDAATLDVFVQNIISAIQFQTSQAS